MPNCKQHPTFTPISSWKMKRNILKQIFPPSLIEKNEIFHKLTAAYAPKYFTPGHSYDQFITISKCRENTVHLNMWKRPLKSISAASLKQALFR